MKTAPKQPKKRRFLIKFLRRQALHVLAFGYITALRDADRSLGYDLAIERFKTRFAIDEDEVSEDSLLKEVHRMNVELMNEPL
jgi:hypothetical protein